MIDPDMTYETAIARVAEIRKRMESERTPLHQTVMLFREGKALLAWADADLRACERDAQELIARDDGAFELTDVTTPPRATAA